MVRQHDISIHALREEGDCQNSHLLIFSLISIHALREEGDPLSHGLSRLSKNFYPRPPRGGRPQDLSSLRIGWKFLSTPSARRATL